MVRMFSILSTERQFQFVAKGLSVHSAKEFTPRKGDADYARRNDVPWIKRFAEGGGKVIISGDAEMRRQPHERLALLEAGMVVLFFDAQWSKWPFFRKMALIMNWWPKIVDTARGASPGTFWRVPCSWGEDAALREISTQDKRLIKRQRQLEAQPAVRAAREKRKNPLQSDLDFGEPGDGVA